MLRRPKDKGLSQMRNQKQRQQKGKKCRYEGRNCIERLQEEKKQKEENDERKVRMGREDKKTSDTMHAVQSVLVLRLRASGGLIRWHSVVEWSMPGWVWGQQSG